MIDCNVDNDNYDADTLKYFLFHVLVNVDYHVFSIIKL